VSTSATAAPTGPPVGEVGGLRERKKASTRHALSEAAVRLCREHGYAEVTVADIADAAGVSRRTFSNYFAGKAECVAAFGEGVMDDILDVLLEADPAAELESLLALGLDRFADRLDDDLEEFLVLMQSQADLRTASVAATAREQATLSAVVAKWTGMPDDDIRAAAFATAAAGIAKLVSDRWIAAGRPDGRNGLHRLFDAAFSVLNLGALRA